MAIEKYFQTIDGSQIFYQIFGKETNYPLVLLHGNGNDHTFFNYQISYFSKEYQVIAVDTRGHGRSTNTQSQLTFPLLAEDLAGIIQQEHLTKTNLLGFSDGANIAMVFTHLYPDFVNKLVLNSGNVTMSGLKKYVTIATYFQYWFCRIGAFFSKKLRARLPIVALLFEDTGLTKQDLEHIPCPTLVITGSRDLIALSHSRAIADAIPDGKLVLVNKQGHLFAKNSPDIFNKTIEKFLKEMKVSK